MQRIDGLFLKYPFYGSRQMARQLRRQGDRVGRRRVRHLMRLLGLGVIYQAPRTSAPHPAHRVYPYLLRGIVIEHPGQVWCADITYSAPRPGWSGVRMFGMVLERRKIECLAPCCEGARAEAAMTCCQLAG